MEKGKRIAIAKWPKKYVSKVYQERKITEKINERGGRNKTN